MLSNGPEAVKPDCEVLAGLAYRRLEASVPKRPINRFRDRRSLCHWQFFPSKVDLPAAFFEQEFPELECKAFRNEQPTARTGPERPLQHPVPEGSQPDHPGLPVPASCAFLDRAPAV